MATIEREFYCSARGPAPTDEDTWRLVFDPTRCVFWFGATGRRPDITASTSSRSASFWHRTEPLQQS